MRGMNQAEKLERLVESPKIIAVTSGKGGVGKSSFSLNLAISLSHKNKKVLLIDGDIGLANIEIMLGIVPRYTLLNIIRERLDIKDIVTKTKYGIDILSGGNGINEILFLNDIDRENIANALYKLFSEYDYAIIDTGAGAGETVTSFLKLADRTYVVMTTEPTSITDAYTLIKVLVNKGIVSKLYGIINMCPDTKEAAFVAKKFSLALEKFLKLNIEEYYILVMDAKVPKSIKSQVPYVLSYPTGKYTKEIERISEDIVLVGEKKKEHHISIKERFKRIFLKNEVK
jgi:flagellar biosynthesis protein FlhG